MAFLLKVTLILWFAREQMTIPKIAIFCKLWCKSPVICGLNRKSPITSTYRNCFTYFCILTGKSEIATYRKIIIHYFEVDWKKMAMAVSLPYAIDSAGSINKDKSINRNK